MSGAYAKEFEKWLQGSRVSHSKSETSNDGDSVDMDDSNDEVDSYQTDKSPKDSDGPPPALPDGLPCHLDEPPILEPVRCTQTKSLDNLPVSSSHNKPDDKEDFIAYKTNSENKAVEVLKDKSKNMESEKSFSYDKVDNSGNIFDKFSVLSETDDFPPPLIPSHEAHLTTVDAKDDDSFTEKSYATIQNLSPNFCAMEADSTSEMMKSAESIVTDRLVKAPANTDIGMECDSTCMLSVSPHVVSPRSNVDSDNPHTPYSVDDGNPPLSWNTFSSRGTLTSLMPFSEQTHLDYKNTFLSTDSIDNGAVYHHESVGDWDRECPKLEAVQDVEVNDALPSLIRPGDHHGPPVLSVVPPPSLISPRMAARRKRHTIDSVESVSRKHKAYSKDSCETKLPHMGPSSSKLNKNSVNWKDERSNSFVKKRRDSLVSKTEARPRKHRERCKTLPIVDLISFGSHLPQDLYDFVVTSSQLSTLQNRMHRLVYLLFPQLASAIQLMSPESSQFEMLLKDLIHYLKEQQAESESKLDFIDEATCPSDSNRNSVTPASDESNKSYDISVQNLDSHSQSSRVKTDDSFSTKDSSQHSSSGVFFNSSHPTSINTNSDLGGRSCKSVIPQFSQLSLNEESKRILRNQPSVLIHKDPHSLHRNFCRLSCSALQLLLPDLNVNLMKEFSDSPTDLLHFIDSVISSNTHSDE